MTKRRTITKQRWNVKVYDDYHIRVPKGRKKDIDARLKSEGKTFNGIVNQFLQNYLGFTEEQWKEIDMDDTSDKET